MEQVYERSDYALLISLMTREEAEVVAAALRADGIDAFLGNSHHAYFDWSYMVALGGLQVMVPREQLVEAKQALQERIRENADAHPEDRVQRRDRWKLWAVIGGSVGLSLVGIGGVASHQFDSERNIALEQLSMRAAYGDMMRRDCEQNPAAVFQLQTDTGWRLVDCRGTLLSN